MKPSNPDAAFNADKAVDFRSIAAQIAAMNPSALTPDQLPDVLTLIEFMRDETGRRFEALNHATKELAQKEAEITRRERDADLRARAANAAISIKKAPWFSRYLGK